MSKILAIKIYESEINNNLPIFKKYYNNKITTIKIEHESKIIEIYIEGFIELNEINIIDIFTRAISRMADEILDSNYINN